MYEQLIKFLKKYFSIDKIDEKTDIFELGYVNSLFLQQLVLYLEKKFDITVEITDMSIENFSTINNIISFVQRKQKISSL